MQIYFFIPSPRPSPLGGEGEKRKNQFSLSIPDINQELEEKWYKNGKIDLCNETFVNVEDMKNFYINLRK